MIGDFARLSGRKLNFQEPENLFSLTCRVYSIETSKMKNMEMRVFVL